MRLRPIFCKSGINRCATAQGSAASSTSSRSISATLESVPELAAIRNKAAKQGEILSTQNLRYRGQSCQCSDDTLVLLENEIMNRGHRFLLVSSKIAHRRLS